MTFHTSHEHCFLLLQQVVISCDDGPKTASVELLTGSCTNSRSLETWEQFGFMALATHTDELDTDTEGRCAGGRVT